MAISFSNLSEFIAMDGHGIYVWSTYGIALIIIIYNVAAPFIKKRQFYQRWLQVNKIKR